MFRAEFKVVILDESHYVKNPSAARTENVVDIVKKAKRRILLTGTPALARPSELYSQIDSILPGKGEAEDWLTDFTGIVKPGGLEEEAEKEEEKAEKEEGRGQKMKNIHLIIAG